MKTKNIFKVLALAMLMPAMMLTTACSNDDDLVNNENTENTIKKGYTLSVTVNVTRQGDATTRATYNEGTKKLSFSSGDELYVAGSYDDDKYDFAGTLEWKSEGTFSGTIITETEYSGTAQEFLAAVSSAKAYLLPAGYDTYRFLFYSDITGLLSWNYTNAFTTVSKAEAVEQFSLEYAVSYSNGFALSPGSAILNFTITGLTANTNFDVSLAPVGPNNATIEGKVKTDGSGIATFAVGVPGNTDLKECKLTVGINDITNDITHVITLVDTSTTLASGKIYNITRSVQ